MSVTRIHPEYLAGWKAGAQATLDAPGPMIPQASEPYVRGYADGQAAQSTAVAVEQLREDAEARFARARGRQVTPQEAIDQVKRLRERGAL